MRIQRNITHFIRQSTDEDLHSIISWLPSDKNEFRNLLSLSLQEIKQAHHSGILFSLITQKNRTAIGFVVLNQSIRQLYIRPSKQNAGYGTSLLKFAEEHLLDRGVNVSEIIVYPECATRFLISQNYKSSSGAEDQMYKLLKRQNTLPTSGESAIVEFKVYDESTLYAADFTRPLSEKRILGVIKSDIVHLEDRAIFYRPDHALCGDNDLVLAIKVKHKMIFQGKAKSPEARRMGIHTDGLETFFCDSLKTHQESFGG